MGLNKAQRDFARKISYLSADRIKIGEMYIHCPLNGIPRVVQVCGVKYSSVHDKAPLFFVRYVNDDGTLSNNSQFVGNWFKVYPSAFWVTPQPKRKKIKLKLEIKPRRKPGESLDEEDLDLVEEFRKLDAVLAEKERARLEAEASPRG